MLKFIPELKRVSRNILFLSVESDDLILDFEELKKTFTTMRSSSKALKLKESALPEGFPLSYWMALNLGKDEQIEYRLQIMGLALKEQTPPQEVWDSVDMIFLSLPQEIKKFEYLLKFDPLQYNKTPPLCLILNKHQLKDDAEGEKTPEAQQIKDQFYKKALLSWLQRKCPHLLAHSTLEEKSLSQSLEWGLSFS